MKSSEVSIKTRSTPASLTIQGQVTKDTTVTPKKTYALAEACSKRRTTAVPNLNEFDQAVAQQ